MSHLSSPHHRASPPKSVTKTRSRPISHQKIPNAAPKLKSVKISESDSSDDSQLNPRKKNNRVTPNIFPNPAVSSDSESESDDSRILAPYAFHKRYIASPKAEERRPVPPQRDTAQIPPSRGPLSEIDSSSSCSDDYLAGSHTLSKIAIWEIHNKVGTIVRIWSSNVL